MALELGVLRGRGRGWSRDKISLGIFLEEIVFGMQRQIPGYA